MYIANIVVERLQKDKCLKGIKRGTNNCQKGESNKEVGPAKPAGQLPSRWTPKHMIKLEKMHEKESLRILLPAPVEGNRVISYFTQKGAKVEDDFFYEDRIDKVEPWQSLSTYTVDCFFEGETVYPDESNVDVITFNYLFSSTPINCFARFMEIVDETCKHFNGSLKYKEEEIEPKSLNNLRVQWESDLEEELAEKPGSERLAILIQDLFYER